MPQQTNPKLAKAACPTCGVNTNDFCSNSWHLSQGGQKEAAEPRADGSPLESYGEKIKAEIMALIRKYHIVGVALDWENTDTPTHEVCISLNVDAAEAPQCAGHDRRQALAADDGYDQPVPSPPDDPCPVSLQRIHLMARACRGHGWKDWANELTQIAAWLERGRV